MSHKLKHYYIQYAHDRSRCVAENGHVPKPESTKTIELMHRDECIGKCHDYSFTCNACKQEWSSCGYFGSPLCLDCWQQKDS